MLITEDIIDNAVKQSINEFVVNEVFNTPGANANGVKELVFAGMLYASRDLIGGIEWCIANKDDENIAKTAEKEKKHFAGTISKEASGQRRESRQRNVSETFIK